MLTVDAQRLNLTDFVTAQIRYAVLNLQHHIIPYRAGHETVYGREDLTKEGKASVGTLPAEAKVREMWRVRTGSTCVRQPAILYPGGWDHRFDLVCGRPQIFECHSWVVLPPQGREFMVYPAIEAGYELDVFWDGVKLEYEDADSVPYDEMSVPCVADYVKAMVAKEVHKDTTLQQMYWRDFMRERRSLYVSAKDRQELNPILEAPQMAVNCAACCCSTSTEDTEIEFVAFGSSGDDTASILYPYPYTYPAERDDHPVRVAELARSLEPDLIMHLGDAGYPTADASTYQDQILKHYGSYIEAEKLYIAMGNHDDDWLFTKLAYLGELNTDLKYYQFTEGPCEFFVLDSNGDVTVQNAWLQAALLASAATWKIVALHHAPYTSDETHQPGDTTWRLDFSEADLVLAGHGHLYERLLVDEVPYLVCGLGGRQARAFVQPAIDGSQYQYYWKHGLLHVVADSTHMVARFVNVDNEEIDKLVLTK